MGIKINDIIRVVRSRPENDGKYSIQDRIGEQFIVLKVFDEGCYVKDGKRFLTVYNDEIELLRGGCEYCVGDVDDREILLDIYNDYYDIHVYIDGNNNLTNDTAEKKINYCPMCGREL